MGYGTRVGGNGREEERERERLRNEVLSLTFSTSVSGMKKDKLVTCHHCCIPVGPLNFISPLAREEESRTGDCRLVGCSEWLQGCSQEGAETLQSMAGHVTSCPCCGTLTNPTQTSLF